MDGPKVVFSYDFIPLYYVTIFGGNKALPKWSKFTLSQKLKDINDINH